MEPRPLTAAEARRAVFIDFEGTRKDPPSLLGVYVAGKRPFRQYVIDPVLSAAAKYKSPRVAWRVKASGPVEALEELRRIVEPRGRRVFSWSKVERIEIAKLVAGRPGLAAFWAGRVEDAIPYAKAWKARAHPGVKLKTRPGRGRNTLENYEALIGLDRHASHRWGNTGKRVREVKEALRKRGSMARLTRTQKGYWTNLLIHNENDCRGMAAVVAVIAGLVKPGKGVKRAFVLS